MSLKEILKINNQPKHKILYREGFVMDFCVIPNIYVMKTKTERQGWNADV